jgi:hypothetical protein
MKRHLIKDDHSIEKIETNGSFIRHFYSSNKIHNKILVFIYQTFGLLNVSAFDSYNILKYFQTIFCLSAAIEEWI